MTSGEKTILGVFAHPDDESMGPGATLARYAVAGHRVAFVTATDGGAGRLYDERPSDNTELRRLRREETEAAAKVLGAEFLGFMGLEDNDLVNRNVLALEVEYAKLIRREKPDVLITFHGSGISYHPDHRVISMALAAAFHGSARAGWYRDDDVEALPPHAPSKLYHYTIMKSVIERVDWPRSIYASPDEEVSTLIDTRTTADIKWKAIRVHDTQRGGPPFKNFYEAGVFDQEGFVRIFPCWSPGDAVETDLLAGLG